MANTGQALRKQSLGGTKQSSIAPQQTANRFPSHEEISRRAYEIYLARGGEQGREAEDWFQAERELREARGTRQA